LRPLPLVFRSTPLEGRMPYYVSSMCFFLNPSRGKIDFFPPLSVSQLSVQVLPATDATRTPGSPTRTPPKKEPCLSTRTMTSIQPPPVLRAQVNYPHDVRWFPPLFLIRFRRKGAAHAGARSAPCCSCGCRRLSSKPFADPFQ